MANRGENRTEDVGLKHPTFSLLNVILVISLCAALSAWFQARLEIQEMKEELIEMRVKLLVEGVTRSQSAFPGDPFATNQAQESNLRGPGPKAAKGETPSPPPHSLSD